MSRDILYEKVVSITSAYLGPAADRFVARQIRNHLDKEPEQLAKRDLRTLIDWIEPAMSLISDDAGLVAEYIETLEVLADGSKERKTYAKNAR